MRESGLGRTLSFQYKYERTPQRDPCSIMGNRFTRPRMEQMEIPLGGSTPTVHDRIHRIHRGRHVCKRPAKSRQHVRICFPSQSEHPAGGPLMHPSVRFFRQVQGLYLPNSALAFSGISVPNITRSAPSFRINDGMSMTVVKEVTRVIFAIRASAPYMPAPEWARTMLSSG